MSVLESHHAAVGWSLLTEHSLLKSFSPGERAELRRLFVTAILATDMGKHKELLSRVTDTFQDDASGLEPAGVTLDERVLLVSFVLRAQNPQNLRRLIPKFRS